MPFWHTHMHPMMSSAQKQYHLVVGHTLTYILFKFKVNQTNSLGNISTFVSSPFTKLDACHGYWSIVLDQDSSLLMTFNSPFGRYHFLQLPFGLVCSQDIFQKKMDQILEECQGCIGITDDITIHSHTEAEHDAHL